MFNKCSGDRDLGRERLRIYSILAALMDDRLVRCDNGSWLLEEISIRCDKGIALFDVIPAKYSMGII